MTRLATIALLLLAAPALAQETAFPLASDGTIPAWLVAGPFEQPLVGFGEVRDADAIGEATAAPAEGQTEASPLVEGGTVAWRPVHADDRRFVDFHAAMSWAKPGAGPAKLWWAKAGYAFVTIESPAAQEVLLLTGSNARLRVLLNGEVVRAVDADRNAEPDSDTTRVRLAAGANRLLVKVGQSHRNEALQFFVPLRWEWGFYARLLRPDGAPADVRAVVPTTEASPAADLVPTFFFREVEGGLEQRFDLVVTARAAQPVAGAAEIGVGEEVHRFALGPVPFGESRHALWLPEVAAETPARLAVRLGDAAVERAVTLAPQPKVEIHLMLLSHNDIGYTDPQPVVQAKQARTLDDVLALCEAEPDFRWTIETTWQLRQFEAGRAPEVFDRLMAQVARGCIAVSPLYANPYTGWVSEEEMIRSLDTARDYAERYGLDYRAAVYNDVPGFSWFVPKVLREAGVPFLVAGLNEIFNDYAFQRTLPKAFWWEGADGSRVLTYRTEAYNEGQNYGMVKGPAAMEHRMWERLHRLIAAGEPHELVLLNSTFGDNGGVPHAELASARAWNEEFAFPKVVVSHADAFAEAFARRYGEALPTVRGDWTSTWDVLGQGELGRVVRQRWAQHQLPTAEALATVGWLLDPARAPLQPAIAAAYDALQQYSGHGSGLEYGYGSPEENRLTMAFRDGYVQEAFLATEAVRERALFRLVQPEEAFETPALYVFNGLSWQRDAPVEVEFPEPAAERYRVVDLATGEALPSRHDGYTLRFVARDLPAVGYRKLALQPRTPADDAAESDLALGAHAIENAFYRLAVDPATGAVTSLLDRKAGRELVPAEAPLPFGVPLREVAAVEPGFQVAPAGAVRVTVRDERPARVVLMVERDGSVVARTEYTLWQGLDRVDIAHVVDLAGLGETDQLEEYGVAFPFALDDPAARFDVLGGFLDPASDRFEGVGHDAHSIRRSAVLFDGRRSVSWAAVDTRVVRWREIEGAPVLIATLVNNFPEHWNRWEERAGTWPLRFRLTSRPGGFDPAFTSRFGHEAAAEPVVSPTWLRTADPVRSYVEVEGETVVLLALKPGADGESVLLRLMNTDPERPARAAVSSPLFEPAAAWRVSFLEEVQAALDTSSGSVSVELGPSEVATLKVRLAPRSTSHVHQSTRGTP